MKPFLRALCCAVLLAILMPAGAARLGPSDCRARDADSTCARAVAAPTAPLIPDGMALLYDGALGGVPAAGYAYWGYDFIADESGSPSPVRPDEFINRSTVPVTITFRFDFPQSHPCDHDCLPGLEFEMGPGWAKVDPPFVKLGHTASASVTIPPGAGYGWIIGLWESTNPRMTVTVPTGATATMRDVGLVPDMAASSEVPLSVSTCQCDDGTLAACSDGDHFSNGKLGTWRPGNVDGYMRAGAFDDCPFR